MQSKMLITIAMAALALAACNRHDANSEGNGPGDADGFGGRQDAPADSQQQGTGPENQPAEKPPADR